MSGRLGGRLARSPFGIDDANPAHLPTIRCQTAALLRGVGWSTAGHRRGVDAFAFRPSKHVVRVVDVRASHFCRMLSGRISQLADTIVASLPSVGCLATLQFCALTWGVAGGSELAFALRPWEGVVGMVCGNKVTLKFAMTPILGDKCSGKWEVGVGGSGVRLWLSCKYHANNKKAANEKEGAVSCNELHFA